MSSLTFNHHQLSEDTTTTRYPVDPRFVNQDSCLNNKGLQLRFDPDHDQSSSQRQSNFTRPTPTHFSSNSTPNMQHYTDDLYPLEPLYPTDGHFHSQAHFAPSAYPPHQQQQIHHHQHSQNWMAASPADYVPVQRQVPSTRAFGYQPYPTASPRVSHYVAPTPSWDVANVVDYSLLDYPSVAYGSFGSTAVSANGLSHSLDSHSFSSHGLYNQTYPISNYSNGSYGLYSQQQQAQQQPTCIAPEDLFARLPMTPISPASLEDSDDRASSPSSAGTSSGNETPLSARSSPNRPELQIPTVPSLSLSTSSIAPSWTTSSSTSTLASPTDSLSSQSSQDDEGVFIPTASLKKAAAANLKAKRSTRSAAPEPAWVEAVLAEDAKRLQIDVAGLNVNAAPARPANRPIAFACVFCRHRKIQCIRPKTEVAPGDKPAPCNQCEKRNRCCEYPPAALNPRVGRRTRPVGSKSEE